MECHFLGLVDHIAIPSVVHGNQSLDSAARDLGLWLVRR